MSANTEERFSVSADDIRSYDFAAVIASSGSNECVYYYEHFGRESTKLQEAGDERGARVFALLSVVASFHPNYDAKGNPYGPLWSGFNGRRALSAEDFSENDLRALGGVVNEIADPDLRARVADVLWVTKRDHKAVKIAIAAFLESAQRLKSGDMWPPYAQRIERAAQLAAIKGFDAEKTDVIKVVETAIAENSVDLKSGLLSERLMGILMLLGAGDVSRYALLSEDLARRFAAESNWHFAEHYWERAELWFRKAKNSLEIQRCQIARAETYISRAEAGLPGRSSNYMYAAHWMGKGLEALRQAKADPARIIAVNKRFLELQKLSLGEMGVVEFPIEKMPGFREDEKKAQEAAVQHVQGTDFQTAIASLAMIIGPTSWEQMKKQHAATAESAPFLTIVGASAIDRTGKTTDTIPAQLPGDAHKNEEAMRKQMVQQAKMVNWPMRVTWTIEPARLAIQQEHGIRARDLWFLVDANPFVPEGHGGIFLRGIQAGFFGDWLTSMHLLVPQIEAAIRYVLQQRGVITSTVDGDGLQKERDLNQLLWLNETEEVFGQDILFDLRGILIERFGHNLRNEFAHGLVPEGGFYNAAAVYLWWLVIHILWRGYHFVTSSPHLPGQPNQSSEP